MNNNSEKIESFNDFHLKTEETLNIDSKLPKELREKAEEMFCTELCKEFYL